MGFRVLFDDNLNNGIEKGFSSFAGILYESPHILSKGVLQYFHASIVAVMPPWWLYSFPDNEIGNRTLGAAPCGCPWEWICSKIFLEVYITNPKSPGYKGSCYCDLLYGGYKKAKYHNDIIIVNLCIVNYYPHGLEKTLKQNMSKKKLMNYEINA
ncbi:MAG: hypothetical protein HQK66_01815 [Desulfamplus sp.]|nr:hypothetical protein [Desulfamplus sp.]